MSLVPNKLKASRLALFALLAAGAAAASANVLVVRSSGPSAKSYPAGRSLPDNARIALQTGDTIVLLGARGTRTFRGPGTFSPSQAVQAGVQTVQGANGRRARIGAVRSAGIVPSSPTTIWHVDASQGGTMCLAETSEVMMWRPDSTQAATVTITNAEGGSWPVAWPAGSPTVAWPADATIADGAVYQLRQEGVAVPTEVTFKTVGPVSDELPAVAEALIRHECEEQLDLLLATAPTE